MAAVEQRYARALLDLVVRQDIAAETLRRELAQVAEVVASSQPLRLVLASPVVTWERKRALLETLAQRLGLGRLTRNFLLVAAQRDRMQYLGGIARAFEQLLLEQQGIVTAEVASARALSDEERAGVEQQLQKRLGRKLRIQFRTDPELVGGFRAQVGDQVYDGSIRGRLQRLRAALLHA
ncbi:MAG: ATP synthase F1 subunit delta [Terriglobales bacterium]